MTENQQLVINGFLKLSQSERYEIAELLHDYLSDEPYKFEKKLIEASKVDFGTPPVKRPHLRLVG